MKIKCMHKAKILLFWRFHQTAGLFLCKKKTWTKESKGNEISCVKFL